VVGSLGSEGADEVDALADSFLSERSARGHRKRVPFSHERRGVAVAPLSVHPQLEEILRRGRSAYRAKDEEEEGAAERRSSRASRCGANLVFLRVYMPFDVGYAAVVRRDGRLGLGVAVPGGRSTERVIGHISAWVCTTWVARHTSIAPPDRLMDGSAACTSTPPQIWKNLRPDFPLSA
jgi:hypothetical protein